MKDELEMKIPVSEIFTSIDGEGLTTGSIATFVRVQGCSLRCSYCDSMYAVEPEHKNTMTLKEILNKVFREDTKHITITGGEPLLYRDQVIVLTRELLDKKRIVNIETNGAHDITTFLNEFSSKEKKNIIITMDWKSISSGESSKMLTANLKALRPETDVLKFVVGSKQDLNQMRDIVRTNSRLRNIFVGPIFGQIEPKEVVQYLLDNRRDLINVRMQLQIHKIIWEPDRRGV